MRGEAQLILVTPSPIRQKKGSEFYWSLLLYWGNSTTHTHHSLHSKSFFRVRVTLQLAVCRQSVRLGNKLLETTSNFIFQLNTCGYSPYVTSSLMRGWVCHLQLLLVLASAVILRSESRGTHDHILLPHIRDSPNLEGRSLDLYSPGTGWPGYIRRHWVPFSAPPTTRKATVEVFDSSDFLYSYPVGLRNIA
jgi:hypothetical protein